jgi:hypothetical protein
VEVTNVSRIAARSPGRSSDPMKANGLRFEKQFAVELTNLNSGTVERNPWFEYHDPEGVPHFCCPDLLWFPPLSVAVTFGNVVVIEVKHTWVPEAQEKLTDLYLPIVRAVQSPTMSDIRPLVVVKNLALGGPKGGFSLRESLQMSPPVLQWRGKGSPLFL